MWVWLETIGQALSSRSLRMKEITVGTWMISLCQTFSQLLRLRKTSKQKKWTNLREQIQTRQLLKLWMKQSLIRLGEIARAINLFSQLVEMAPNSPLSRGLNSYLVICNLGRPYYITESKRSNVIHKRQIDRSRSSMKSWICRPNCRTRSNWNFRRKSLMKSWRSIQWIQSV